MERLTFAASGAVEGRTLSGTAHVYGNVTTDGRKHGFERGALGASLTGDVVSFAFHSDTMPLASLAAGTLRLVDDGSEFRYAIDLPNTSYANDLQAYVDAGNKLGMSFQYVPSRRPSRVNGVTMWSAGRLISVDPVAMAAFEGTSVILNSADYGEPAYSAVIKIKARRLVRNVIALLST